MLLKCRCQHAFVLWLIKLFSFCPFPINTTSQNNEFSTTQDWEKDNKFLERDPRLNDNRRTGPPRVVSIQSSSLQESQESMEKQNRVKPTTGRIMVVMYEYLVDRLRSLKSFGPLA
jgi:hypothetical protein